MFNFSNINLHLKKKMRYENKILKRLYFSKAMLLMRILASFGLNK